MLLDWWISRRGLRVYDRIELDESLPLEMVGFVPEAMVQQTSGELDQGGSVVQKEHVQASTFHFVSFTQAVT